MKDQLFSQYLIAFDQMTLARRFDLRDDLLLELASTFGHTYLTQHAHMQQAATELLQRLTPRPGEKEDYRYSIMKVALFDNPHDYSSLLAQSPGDENIDDQFAMLQARESIRDYTHISIPGSFENTYYERIY